MSSEKELEKGGNPLGQSVVYDTEYQPSLLFPIERTEKRNELGINRELPFNGEDIWNAFELSWLNNAGVPQVGIGEFRFPASSPNIIESKSLKLYLNSLNQTRFTSVENVTQVIVEDLSSRSGALVTVDIRSVGQIEFHLISSFEASCIDQLDISIEHFEYDSALLKLEAETAGNHVEVSEQLCSHLLKSNCLITNQPDWATVYIEYKGAPIDHRSLLKYLISFRTHNEFHEQCVERIYCDIMKRCGPRELTVYARYTRRGGLDINPWRSNTKTSMENTRLARQ